LTWGKCASACGDFQPTFSSNLKKRNQTATLITWE
jgi:hypothetical protein